ncbi:MAG TPA: glycosyltransferase family 1 protein [Leptospiraceae bacterium]|nr:glycosyltransferase family 1 protein [Leptospiraceae bacterium]
MKKNKPLIAVDARPLSYGMTGNSRYLAECLEYLKREVAPFEYVLLSNKPIHKTFEPLVGTGFHDIIIQKSLGVIWLNFTVPRTVKKIQADVFWGTLQLLPVFKLPVPSVVNYHDLNFVSAPETMSRSNRIQHSLLSRFTMKNADKIFCLSENTKNDIKKYRPVTSEKLLTVYPGVKRNSFPDFKVPFENYLLYVGTIEPRKNAASIINAFLSLKKESPDFPYSLVLAGRKGWGEEELISKLENRSLEQEGVFFLENPDDVMLANLYRKCACFLFPSVHEGFGLPLLEAMVENKICIASDIPVFKEILDSSDILVPPRDIEAWKKAFKIFASKKDKTREKKVTDSDWTWKAAAVQIEESLKKVLQ